jgi:predicted secreted protein
MRDEMNPFAPSPGPAPAETTAPADTPAAPVSDQTTTVVNPAVMKFKSCRWRCAPEDGEFCTHRDVLPFAGKNDFKADSWCPECAFYKLRRTPKKREWVDRNSY